MLCIKKMNKIIILLLTSLTINLVHNNIGNAQSTNCSQAIESLKQELRRRNVFNPHNDSIVGRVMPEMNTHNELNRIYFDVPQGRNTEIVFVLTGNHHILANFVNSPRLMESLSSPVIRNCHHIGLINYTRYTAFYFHGPDNNPVGYFLDGSIQKFIFTPLDNPQHYRIINGIQKIRWGYYYSD